MTAMTMPTMTTANETTGETLMFPWSEVAGIESRGNYIIREKLFRLLHAADTSKTEWRRAACHAAAEACWAVLYRRGKAADLEVIGDAE